MTRGKRRKYLSPAWQSGGFFAADKKGGCLQKLTATFAAALYVEVYVTADVGIHG